jgi:phosphoribosylglycinamide formyltransferase-1
MVKLNWTVFISQTGSEIMNISKESKIYPKVIYSNNKEKVSKEVEDFFNASGVSIKQILFKPTKEDYLQEEILDSKLITLHGYLRIIPAEFLEKYEGKILNGHPALINKYPELKGFNMQEKAFTEKKKYPFIGSVIHKVTPKVDDGQIYVTSVIDNDTTSIDDAYDKLKATSFDTWIKFFKEGWKSI